MLRGIWFNFSLELLKCNSPAQIVTLIGAGGGI